MNNCSNEQANFTGGYSCTLSLHVDNMIDFIFVESLILNQPVFSYPSIISVLKTKGSVICDRYQDSIRGS